MARAAALLLVFLAAAGPIRAQLSGAATVTDVDTLRLDAERIRLPGIHRLSFAVRQDVGRLVSLASHKFAVASVVGRLFENTTPVKVVGG